MDHWFNRLGLMSLVVLVAATVCTSHAKAAVRRCGDGSFSDKCNLISGGMTPMKPAQVATTAKPAKLGVQNGQPVRNQASTVRGRGTNRVLSAELEAENAASRARGRHRK